MINAQNLFKKSISSYLVFVSGTVYVPLIPWPVYRFFFLLLVAINIIIIINWIYFGYVLNKL